MLKFFLVALALTLGSATAVASPDAPQSSCGTIDACNANCQHDDANACFDLAVLVDKTPAARSSVGYDAAERACSLDAKLCARLGDYADVQQTVPQRIDREHFYQLAKLRLVTACDHDDVQGCYALGVLLDRPASKVTDVPASRVALRKSCAANVDAACRYLAEVSDDHAETRRLFERLCTHTNEDQAISCSDLGVAAERGFIGVPKNRARAHALFTKACKLGYEYGCIAAKRTKR